MTRDHVSYRGKVYYLIGTAHIEGEAYARLQRNDGTVFAVPAAETERVDHRDVEPE